MTMLDQTAVSACTRVDGCRPVAVDFQQATSGSTVSIPLIVESELSAAAKQPVKVGIPWPRGVLKDNGDVSLIDSFGQQVPLQVTPLAHWSDGSVKWLLLDFIVNPAVAGRSVWTLATGDVGPPARVRAEGALFVEEAERHLMVNTGTALFTLDRKILAPIHQVEIGGNPILDPARTRTVLTDARGRCRRPLIERCEVEAVGPVRVTVRLEGTLVGRRRHVLRFLARLSFFAGSSLTRVELTLHNPRRARHRGGLWDLGDPGSILFRDLSLQLGLTGSGCRQVQWTEDATSPLQTTPVGTFEIYQDSSGGENWASRNHVNRHGQVPCRFRGYRVRRGDETLSGLRASPSVSVRGPAGTITAAIPEFWQQFPKAIDTEGGTLNLRLFPGQFGDLFELQGGEQKTHTLWLHFSWSDRSEINALEWVHRPARARWEPEWVAETRAIPDLSPVQPDSGDRYESFVSTIVEGPRRLAARREIIDEYGWRHYGDVYADHEGAYYGDETPIISHYNNQYDVINGLLIQFFRTGDPRWFDLAGPLARHVMDIDIYHTNEDRAAYNGGMFWHTDHYRDAATSTHRAYSRTNCGSNKRAYGGGPSNEHNYTTGLLNYYYLTGDTRAREAVLSLADWVVSMDDGRKSILRLIDDGPTGLASRTTQADYHGPGRGCGNSINALLDAWLVTRSRVYLDQAEALIRRAVHPAMDITALNLLETELRWSYTVFLSILARYLDLKAEPGGLDDMYAYARSCLLAFAGWMADHEIPYFDRPEKLEYPTETWAAQELRKANVLRLAARHAGEPMRIRLIDRSKELADRAWTDLLRFESHDVTRSLALIMSEGARDAYWRTRAVETMPAPSGNFDHGAFEMFVPQRRRVANRIKAVFEPFRAPFQAIRARGIPR